MADYVWAIEVGNSDPKKRTGSVFKVPLRLCALLVPPDQLKTVLSIGAFEYQAVHTPYLKSLLLKEEDKR